jgi:hypothetical protein
MNDLNAAHGMIQLHTIARAKSSLARLMASRPSPALDWLLEQGFVKVRPANSARGLFTQGKPAAYVTPTGKRWFHAYSGGVMSAVIAVAQAERAAA